MSSPPTLAQPRPNGWWRLTQRLLVLLASLAVAVSGFTVLTSGTAEAAPKPPYPVYDPQTKCNPWAKRGTVFLARWLLRNYPGSTHMGISRACSVGGRSEHKEGRAFDWGLNVYNARHRSYATAFRRYLFKTGPDGLRHARARRMGVMYIIWNDHIYSAGNRYAARPYRPCRTLSNCSKTQRHRDHMHISLSRAGGAGHKPWFYYHGFRD